MNKLSKYLSLIKFSFFQPKHGVELFQTYRQTNEDSKQTILPHEHSAMEIEKCLKSLFPELDTKKDNLLDQTKKLDIIREEHTPTIFPELDLIWKNYGY